jgi:hypothetical protein
MLCAFLAFAPGAQAENVMGQTFEDFSGTAGERWQYVADGVMGGVSQGEAEFVEADGGQAVRLHGQVSTENNGGFIQVRHRFDGGLPADARGLRLSVRGNGERYFVFLRTRGLERVFHSYRHAFEAEADWREVTLEFADFYPSHDGMPEGFSPEDVFGIGIVAYGRDFEADVTVREVTVY